MSREEKKKIIIVTVSTICGILFLAGLLTLFGYYCQKRAKAKEKTAELTARMTGYDDIEVRICKCYNIYVLSVLAETLNYKCCCGMCLFETLSEILSFNSSEV